MYIGELTYKYISSSSRCQNVGKGINIPIYNRSAYAYSICDLFSDLICTRNYVLHSQAIIYLKPHLITLHSETPPYKRTNFQKVSMDRTQLSSTQPMLIAQPALNDCNSCNMLQCTVLNCLQWAQTSSTVSKLTRCINAKRTMAPRCLSLKSLHCVASLMTRNEAEKLCIGMRCSIRQRQKDTP